MTVVGYVVKQLTVKITPPGGGAAVAYECAVTSVQDTPSRDTVTMRTACPDGVKQDVGPTSWSLSIVANAVDTPASLFRLLRGNDGAAATVDVEYDPVGDPGRVTHYAVILTAPGQDATVGAARTFTAELPVTGSPTYTDPV